MHRTQMKRKLWILKYMWGLFANFIIPQTTTIRCEKWKIAQIIHPHLRTDVCVCVCVCVWWVVEAASPGPSQAD